jgi:hypothetical protein
MIATLMLAAAVQVAVPTPPPPPSPVDAGARTIVRDIVIHEHPRSEAKDGEGKQERREIIVIRESDRTAQTGPDRRVRIVDVVPGKGSERREIRILREPGGPGTRVAMLSCDDGAKVDSEATDKDGKKTGVMICAKGGSSNVSKAQQLRDAAKRIEADANFSQEARTRIVLAINEAIAKLPVNE